jgi:uncharacterized protein
VTTASRATQIPGPAGRLEALLDVPRAPVRAAAVICHPHPLHQGTMHNKVTYTLARAFARLGAAAVRFNFRGVGASTGRYDNGDGETLDCIAAIEWARSEWPGRPVYLGGFSFGAAVAIRAAGPQHVRGLVTVAPPVERVPAQFEPPRCPWLVLQGEQDDVVSTAAVRGWVAARTPRPELKTIPDAGHFFHGRLRAIAAAVEGFFAADLQAARAAQ